MPVSTTTAKPAGLPPAKTDSAKAPIVTHTFVVTGNVADGQFHQAKMIAEVCIGLQEGRETSS